MKVFFFYIYDSLDLYAQTGMTIDFVEDRHFFTTVAMASSYVMNRIVKA